MTTQQKLAMLSEPDFPGECSRRPEIEVSHFYSNQKRVGASMLVESGTLDTAQRPALAVVASSLFWTAYEYPPVGEALEYQAFLQDSGGPRIDHEGFLV